MTCRRYQLIREKPSEWQPYCLANFLCRVKNKVKSLWSHRSSLNQILWCWVYTKRTYTLAHRYTLKCQGQVININLSVIHCHICRPVSQVNCSYVIFSNSIKNVQTMVSCRMHEMEGIFAIYSLRCCIVVLCLSKLWRWVGNTKLWQLD